MMKTKKSKLILLLLFVLFPFATNGQINTYDKPISFEYQENMFKTNIEMLKIMPPLDLEKLNEEDEEDEWRGIPPRFGFPHEVNFSLENSGEWFDLPNGDKLWKLEISCPDALSINLLYDKFWLPDGAKFFIYSNDKKYTIGAFTSKNNNGDREKLQGFATGLIYGNKITLEYYLPKEVIEQGIISICNVVQGYRYISINYINDNKKIGDFFQGFNDVGNSCQVNINCPEGDGWQEEKNSVAIIIVNGTRGCTGFLINNKNPNYGEYYPFLLTANHCSWAMPAANGGAFDAITNPNLSNWLFYWHYETPGCNNLTSDPLPNTPYTQGATVVANNGINAADFTLLRLNLNDDPKNKTGVRPYYLGWDTTGNSGTGGVGIHHPLFDVKKISTYTSTPPVNSYCASNNKFWDISFVRTVTNHSIVLNGSSGSPLINNNRKVIGILHGPYSESRCPSRYCNNPANQTVAYGKFSVAWTGDGASDSRRRLWDHLGTNSIPTTLDAACWSTLVYGQRPRPTITTERIKCREIIVQDAEVPAGKTLELEATDKVTIDGNFKVESGATFIIR